MSGPPDRLIVARRWMRWAQEDLLLAERTAADDDLVPRGACVWAHQAVEKALKAVLVARDIDPPKLHDLDRLAGRLPAEDAAALASSDLAELSRWSIEGRYPADLEEATRIDAERAIDLARSVLAAVATRADLSGG